MIATKVHSPGSVVLAALAAAALIVSGCASETARLDAPQNRAAAPTAALKSARPEAASAPARTAATVKVGVMLPLTGPGQAGLIAQTMKNAIELAHSEARVPHVTLVVQDDKGTPEGAEAAMKELVGQHVEIVLGPLFARSVQAAAPLARSANLPLLAFSNDRQVAGQAVSLLSFLAEPEVQRVVSYAAGKGKKRQAALIPTDSYGRLVEAAYRNAAGRNGVDIVALETYAPDTPSSVAEAVRKLRDTVRGLEEHGDPVQALFVPGGEEALAQLNAAFKGNGVDIKRFQVLGTGAMDFPTAGRDGTLVGAWFAAPDPKGWAAFTQRYAGVHGHQPPRISSLAYDAMMLAASLSNGPDGARYIPSQLARASGFEGIDGAFRILADGTTERPLAILEVREEGAAVVDAAPANALATASRTPPTTVQAPTARSVPARAEGGFLSTIPSAFPPVN